MYLSGIDPAIRAAFSAARQFVTPYAATGIDEYFAECVRAWVEANDPASAWPAVSRERLERLDPAMHGIIKGIFEGEAGAGSGIDLTPLTPNAANLGVLSRTLADAHLTNSSYSTEFFPQLHE